MALTGLFLIAFLVVHVMVNACMWARVFVPGDNGEVFNKAAHWLGQTMIPRILEIALFIVFIIHIIQGYVLEVQNRQRRGIGYKVKMGSNEAPGIASQWACLVPWSFISYRAYC
jgi:succinate dehydrogenase / fumarate reductase cytochrome b subunit